MYGKRKVRPYEESSLLPKAKKICRAPSNLQDLNTKTLKMMQEGAKRLKETQKFQKYTLPLPTGSLKMCKLCNVMNELKFKECSFCNALCCEECIGECFVCNEHFCHLCSTCKFVAIVLIFVNFE